MQRFDLLVPSVHEADNCLERSRSGRYRAPVHFGARCVATATIVTILAATANLAHARCMDPYVHQCKVNGWPPGGTEVCHQGCIPTAQKVPLRPRYLVTTIIYAPPGFQNKSSMNSVQYTGQNTTGVTTSLSSSFKVSSSLAVGLSIGKTDSSVGGDYTITVAENQSQNDSVDIKETNGQVNKVDSPAVDGTDHNFDRIDLLVKPTVDLRITPGSVIWDVVADENTWRTPVLVSQLKNPDAPDPATRAVMKILRDYGGLTDQDFQNILNLDPAVDPPLECWDYVCLIPPKFVPDPGRINL
jgi:hypothetical protein